MFFFALMLAPSDAGFLLGRKSEASTPDKTKSRISVAEDAILGILALLLRIQYVHGRVPFRCRKQLVLDEANAGQKNQGKKLSP